MVNIYLPSREKLLYNLNAVGYGRPFRDYISKGYYNLRYKRTLTEFSRCLVGILRGFYMDLAPGVVIARSLPHKNLEEMNRLLGKVGAVPFLMAFCWSGDWADSSSRADLLSAALHSAVIEISISS